AGGWRALAAAAPPCGLPAAPIGGTGGRAGVSNEEAADESVKKQSSPSAMPVRGSRSSRECEKTGRRWQRGRGSFGAVAEEKRRQHARTDRRRAKISFNRQNKRVEHEIGGTSRGRDDGGLVTQTWLDGKHIEVKQIQKNRK